MTEARRRHPWIRRLAALAALGGLGAGPALPACPPATTRHETPHEGWCEDAAGARQGPIWGRRSDGSLRFLGTALDDAVHGAWRSWHPGGAPAIEAHYAHGVLTGPFRLWGENGRLLYTGRHDALGRMDGRFERRWPDGTPRLRWEMRAGVHHGAIEGWYASGARRVRGARRDGRDSGDWSWWDEHGRLERRCRFEAGIAVAGPCRAPADAPARAAQAPPQ